MIKMGCHQISTPAFKYDLVISTNCSPKRGVTAILVLAVESGVMIKVTVRLRPDACPEHSPMPRRALIMDDTGCHHGPDHS